MFSGGDGGGGGAPAGGPFALKTTARKVGAAGASSGLFGMPAPAPLGSPQTLSGGNSLFGVSNIFGTNTESSAKPFQISGLNVFGGRTGPTASGSTPFGQFSSTAASSQSFGEAASQQATIIGGASQMFSQSAATSVSIGQTTSTTVTNPFFGRATAVTTVSSQIVGHGSTVMTSSQPFATTGSSTGPVPVFGQAASTALSNQLFGPKANTIANSRPFGQPDNKTATIQLFGKLEGNTASSQLFVQSNKKTTSSQLFSQADAKSASSQLASQSSLLSGGKLFSGSQPTAQDLDGGSSRFGPSKVASGSAIFSVKDTSAPRDANIFQKPTALTEQETAGRLLFSSALSAASGESSRGSEGKSTTVGARDVFSKREPSGAQAANNIFTATMSGSKGVQPDVTVPAAGRTWQHQRPTKVDDDVFEEDEEQPEEAASQVPTRDRHTSEVSEAGSEISESGTKRTKFKRLTSMEELKSITSIICENVPDLVNNSVILKKHFSKFGEVLSVVPNLRRKNATVHFKDHRGAKLAKARGKTVSAKVPPIGEIFYKQMSPGAAAKVAGRLAAQAGTSQDTGRIQTTVRQAPTAKRKVFNITKALTTREPAAEGSSGTAVEPPRSTGSTAELLRIMQSQAPTDSDKFNVLEARDRYMRLKNPRSVTRSGHDIQTMNLIGTCPDMCSEKERYGRSAKNQLRWFEKQSGILNHMAAVKEHSRSAADQDVPLSHELRPPHILKMTMDYLMCNIVDRIDYRVGSMEDWFCYIEQLHQEGSCLPANPWPEFSRIQDQRSGETVGDWFEFIWSTTRAVRKDITQENLSDLVSVSLVEKCARFHIFSAERLCEEDVHDFDPKLNNENLTKCLQSLKHMYHDLRIDGKTCPNEAEFRAYDILLNLNEGDTLREVQNLSEAVFTDVRLKAALQIFNALNTNNYVKFFRLVGQASYLEACILKRYFYQVRRKGLETILRGYCPSLKQVFPYPLSSLVNTFGFENDADCARFLRYHGVESEPDSDTVFLDRSAFFQPDGQPPVLRSILLIDSKKTTTYGEVMNAGPLPENPYFTYRPHDSFDERGFLRPEAYDAKDQECVEEVSADLTSSPIGQTATQQQSTPPRFQKATPTFFQPDPPAVFQEATPRLFQQPFLSAAQPAASPVHQNVSSSLLEEVCHREMESVATETLREAEESHVSGGLYEKLEAEVVVDEAQTVATEALRDSRNSLLQQRIREERAKEEQEEAAAQIVATMIEASIRKVAEEEMAAAAQTASIAAHEAAATAISQDLVSLVLADQIRLTAANVLAETEQMTRDRTARLLASHRRRRLGVYFRSWAALARKSHNQRTALMTFPAAPSSLDMAEQHRRLQIGRIRSHPPLSVSQVVRQRADWDGLIRRKEQQEAAVQAAILEPFDIAGMVENASLGKDTRSASLFWKIILSCPDLPEDADFLPFIQMLRRKFAKSLGGDEKRNEGLLVCRTVLGQERPGMTLSVCVREVGRPDLEAATFSEGERKRLFSGTSALLALVLGEDDLPRLKSVVYNRPKLPAVPLVVLTPSEEQDKLQSQLAAFVVEGFVSEFRVIEVTDDIFQLDNISALTSALQFLVNRAPKPPVQHLGKKILRDFVEDFLSGEFYGELYRNLRERRSRGLPHRCPEDIVALYNHTLSHLQSVLADLQLQEISWPIHEFSGSHFLQRASDKLPVNWNDPQYLDAAIGIIDSLRLEVPEVLAADRWEDMVKQVWAYVDHCVATSNQDTTVLISELRRALSKSYRLYNTECARRGGWGDGEELVPPPECLPWTDILGCCVQHKLRNMGELAHRLLCYREEAMALYLPPQQWTRGLGWQTEREETSVHELMNQSISSIREKTTAEEQPIHPHLATLLKTEQKEAMAFEHMLEAALSSDHELRSSLNTSARADKSITELEPAEQELSEDEDWEVTRDRRSVVYKELVPIIGYVSPSLGSLVSPHLVTSRVEVFSTGRAAKYSGAAARRSLDIPRKRKAAGSPPSAHMQHANRFRRLSGPTTPRLKIHEKMELLRSQICQDATSGPTTPRLKIEEKMELLRSQICQDATSGAMFEKRLEAALRQ